MRKKTFPTFEEAKTIVKEKGIKDIGGYQLEYKKLGLPSNPNHSYKEKGQIGWTDFLGTDKYYPTYEDAKKIVKDNNLQTREKYKASFKKYGLPADPSAFYKKKGWIDYYDFFGHNSKDYPSYEKTKRILKENGITTLSKYKLSRKILGLPSNPRRYFKDKGWIDRNDFLGITTKSYLPYEETKIIVQKIGIKDVDEYRMVSKKHGLPSGPEKYYKDNGWIDWYDFLGKSRKVSSDERKYRILTKLSISPFLLQDDAPLQVIYILASELDKKLANEMEELLAKTSFEERLNWVKEQLNKLKEGGYSIHKTTFVTPSDELSAMESILEEFEVTDKVNFTLENYLHSAVNRELISEYDG